MSGIQIVNTLHNALFFFTVDEQIWQFFFENYSIQDIKNT